MRNFVILASVLLMLGNDAQAARHWLLQRRSPVSVSGEVKIDLCWTKCGTGAALSPSTLPSPTNHLPTTIPHSFITALWGAWQLWPSCTFHTLDSNLGASFLTQRLAGLWTEGRLFFVDTVNEGDGDANETWSCKELWWWSLLTAGRQHGTPECCVLSGC